MATTPNYGFIMPDPTDLVTDLPADFEIFGDEVDLRVKALNPETTEGDLAYRGATADAKDRLGIGTAGQLLAVNAGADAPEWVTPAGGGGYTQLATGALTGSNISLTSISGSFDDLFIDFSDIYPATNSSQLSIRINGNTSGSNYRTTLANVFGGAYDDNQFNISPAMNNSSTQNNFFRVYFYNYADANSRQQMNLIGHNSSPSDATLRDLTLNRWGFFKQTGAITQLDLFLSSGNFGGGTYTLYGVS